MESGSVSPDAHLKLFQVPLPTLPALPRLISTLLASVKVKNEKELSPFLKSEARLRPAGDRQEQGREGKRGAGCGLGSAVHGLSPLSLGVLICGRGC